MNQSSLGASRPLAPPLFLSSVYALPDLDALDRIYDGEPGFVYARDGHPNARDLGHELAQSEGAAWGLICSSGMAALSLAMLGRLSAGDRVIASSRLYGRTASLLRQELVRFGVQTSFVDVFDLEKVEAAFSTPARVLLVETISNPMLRVADLPALARIAHAHDASLIVDNTFASPALCQPLALGADLVMESLTKMIGGHSDLTLGALCGVKPEWFQSLSLIQSTWGLTANPFDCWLAGRGLTTLELRMRAASQHAAALADWLAGQPAVSQVIYPGRADHPDHELSRRLLPLGTGNMLCFELRGEGRASVNAFLRRASGIPFSPSLGDASTTCSYPAATSHRYETPEARKSQGITDGLIRLSVGVEPVEQIQQALAQGLSAV